MPSDSYDYAAFISYRHTEPDRRWAKWLHKSLETYCVPNALVRRGAPRRLGRCFRDEEELAVSNDLSAEIDRALVASKFLIVVCSPRTPASQWVNREVERFRELGRGDRILAVLVEGEPAESFPRALVEIRRSLTESTGLGREQVETIEPLAADVRPARQESRGHLSRMARLRLLARVLDVRFDDLRRREQERRARRLLAATAVLTLTALLIGGLVAFSLVQRAEAAGQRAIADSEARQKRANLALAYFGRGMRAEQARALPEARLAFTEALALNESPDIRARLPGVWFSGRLAWEQAHPTGGAAEAPLPGGTMPATASIACTDDDRVLSAAGGPMLIVWDGKAGSRAATIDVGASIVAVAAGADGCAAVSCLDGTVRAIDLQSARVSRIFKPGGVARGLAVSADGHSLALALGPAGVAMFDWQTGVYRGGKSRHDADATAVRFGPRPDEIAWADHNYLYVARAGETPSDFQVRTNRHALKTDHPITALAWSASQHTVAVANDQRIVLEPIDPPPVPPPLVAMPFFDVVEEATSAPTRTELPGSPAGVSALAFTPDGGALVSGSGDGDVTIWDWRAKVAICTFNRDRSEIRGLAVSPDGKRVVYLTAGGRIGAWELGGEPGRRLYDHRDLPEYRPADDEPRASKFWVTDVTPLADGRAAVRLDSGSLHCFDVATGRHDPEFLAAVVRARGVDWATICWNDDRSKYATVDATSIRLFARGGETPLAEIVTGSAGDEGAQVTGIAWGPGDRGVVAVYRRGEIRSFALDGPASRPAPATVPAPGVLLTRGSAAVRWLISHAASGRVAVAWKDERVEAWDVASGRQFALPPTAPYRIAHLAFDATGRRLAIVCHGPGAATLVCDLDAGRIAYRLPRPAARAAFSPDGRWLALGPVFQERLIHLHRADNGDELTSLAGHTAFVGALAFTPDGRTLLSGGDDKTTRAWDLSAIARLLDDPPAALRATAQANAGAILRDVRSDIEAAPTAPIEPARRRSRRSPPPPASPTPRSS